MEPNTFFQAVVNRKIERLIRITLLTAFLMGLFVPAAMAQCAVTGVSGSGFLFASQCAPATTVIYYEFTFDAMPPQPSYRVLYNWGDGNTQNTFPLVQTRVVGGITVYYVRAELTHTFPANGLCEYEVRMVLVDNGFACSDSRQVQIVGNWHQDDIAPANGVIAINPVQHDVCEGNPLINFRFADATHFACNVQDNPLSQKPNHTPRYEQFIYGTNPAPGQGIPNLFIRVGTAQTVLYLTDNNGNPIPGPFNINPTTGAIVAPYVTQSGYFEGPIVQIPVNPVTGVYALNNTYPISFNGVGTVVADRFQVTVRNWNVCNPWNGNQTAPNAGEANIATALIYIVNGPLANAGPNEIICAGSQFNTNGVLVDGTSALWTRIGDGSFTNATSPGDAVYTPGSGDLLAGFANLVLHAYGTGFCPEHTDTMRLSFDPLPAVPTITISAGSNDFCDNNIQSVTLRSDPSPNGSYLWTRNGVSTGITTQTITLNDYTQTGAYRVIVYGNTPRACPRTSLPFTVTIYRAATVNAGADQTICSLPGTVALTGSRGGSATGSTWTTTGTGTFANPLVTSTTYTTSLADRAAGTVTLTLTTNDPTGPCPAVSDAMVVTINTAAIVSAGPDQAICATASAPLAGSFGGGANTVTWTGGGGVFNPNANSPTAIYTPSAGEVTAGTVTLTLTTNDPGGPCGAVSDNITITIGATLTGAAISGSGNACDGASSWFALTVNGGTPPYLINYTLDGAARPAVPGYTNGTQIPLGVLPIGSHTVHIISIRDACLNFVPVVNLPADYIFSINAIPSASGTINNTPAICNTNITDISLQADIPSSTLTWTVSHSPAVTWVAGRAPTGGSGPIGTVIAQTLEHTSTAPTTVTYSIVPTGPAPTNCPGSTVTRTVIVNPRAQVNDPSDQVVCNGNSTTAVTFSTNRTGGSTTYSWTNNNSAIGLAASGNGNIASFTATNNGSSPSSAIVTVTPTYTSGGISCTGPAQTFSIVVNPSAQVNDPSDQVICNGNPTTAITFTTNRTGGTTTYAWSNNNTSIGLGANGTGNIGSFTATNAGSSPVTATVTVTPTYSNGGQSCSGPAQTFTIVVNPSAQVNDPSDQVVCNGGTTAAVTFTTGNTGGTTTYAWANSNTAIGLGAGAAGNLPAFTATNAGTSPISGTITVTPTFTNGGVSCTGTAQTFTITVNPAAQVNDPADQVHCAGTAVPALNFGTNRTGGTTSYAWTNSNTAIGLGAGAAGNLPAFTATNAGTAPVSGTITVTPTFTNGGVSCTGAAQTFTITVNPAAQVNDPADQVYCAGTAVAALNFSTNRSGGTTTYAWTNSNTAIGLGAGAAGNLPAFTTTNAGSAAISGTITVTPTFANGGVNCTGPAQTFSITVNPTPSLSSTLTPTAVCSNTAFTYTATSATSGVVISWIRNSVAGITPAGPTSGGAAINETLRNITSAPIAVTYRFTLTANGCTNTQDVVVSINPEPVISDQSASVCSGESLVHTILLDNFAPAAGVTFTWPAPALSGGVTGGTARNTPSSADMTDVFVNTSGGAETATYTVTPFYNGCAGQSRNIVVTIGSQPVLDPGLSRNICSGLATGLTLAVAPTSSPATSYDVFSITIQGGLVANAGNVTAANTVGASYLANDRFVNETGGDRTVTYRVRPVFGTTCIGNWVNIVVTVRPQPVIQPNQVKTVCSSTPVNMEIKLVPVNTPAGSTFSWPVPNMQDGSLQGTARTNLPADPGGTLHITDVLVNHGLTPITARYTVTPYSSFTCAGTPVDVVVTVNPEPDPPVITGKDTLCIGENPVVYTVPLHAGSQYFWNVPASVGVKTFDVNSNAIIITAANIAGNGNITVIERNSYGCAGIAGTFQVVVMGPSPVSGITGDATVCALETGVYSVPNRAGSTYTWSLPTGAALIGNPTAASVTVTFGTISGSISVREVNAAGCITNHTPLPVNVRPLPTAIISNNGTICAEGTHPISITLTGASPWSVVYAINGVNQPAITNILTSPYTLNATAAGSYTVVSVTDANLCTNTGIGNATVSYYPVPTATISGTTEMCSGGSALLTITLTGAAPYDFSYSDGVNPAVVVTNHPAMVYTATVTPVANATYTITAMNDNNGCVGIRSGSAVITINPTPVATLAGTNLRCSGDNSGAINLSVASGTPLFSFAWTGPDGFTAGTEDIGGLRAGFYAVTVTDSKGCTATGSITLTQPTPLTLSKSGDILLLCNGATNGAGSFTAAGGTAPYLFTPLVNTAGATITSAASSAAVTNAGDGVITIQVTDANNCTAQSTITVTEPPVLILTVTTANITCYGGNTGTITTTVTGGVAPYLYSWTTVGGSGLTAGASNQSGLTAGTYSVTVTDANGCTATGSWILTQPTELTVNVTADDNLIGTCSDAQLNTTVAGGVMPVGGYLYSWSPAAGLSAANIANPVATPASTTTYTVTVTDANGCTRTGSVTINVAPVLTAVAFTDDNLIGTCPLSDAQLNVNVNGGEAPYSFSWLPVAGLSSAAIQNPLAKPAATTTYTVTVTDANGCTVTADVTINIAPALVATATVDDDPIGMCPTSVAHLSTTVTGGEGGYTYLWNNAATLNSATMANPTAKPATSTLYTVTVTDANGCQTTATVMVNVAPALTVTASANDYIIGTCPTSVANLNALGAGGELLLSGDYIYNWSPAAGLNYTNVQSPVAKPGATTTYTVTITDRNGCTATDQVTITVNPPLALTTTPLVYAGGYNITCFGVSDGAIDLGVTGGEAPYTYAWTGPSGYTSGSDDISGLFAGTYNITVTDANGCSATTTAVLLEPAVLTLGKTPDVVLSCNGDATAVGSFSVSGGTSPYTVSLISDNTGATVTINPTSLAFTGGAAGAITAGVTDANGCTAQATITVTEPPQLLPGTIDGTQEVCYMGNPGALNQLTAPSGGPAVIIMQWERSLDGGANWSIIPGATTASYDPPAGIMQTTQFRRRVNSGSCNAEYSNVIIVTVNPLPVASISGTGFVCPGDPATVTVTVTTGEAPFTVVLSDGTTVGGYSSGSPITVNPMFTTTYTITSITDNNGCVVTAPHANITGSATISTKGVPEIPLQPLNVTVCENAVATFTTDAGMTTNPAYQWYVDTGSGMNIISGANAATLLVTATSAMNAYRYQVVISGDCPVPVTSTAALLTVNEKPEITTQPVSATLCSGEDAVFTADAGVTTNPLYQWYVNAGTGWTPAVGARYQGSMTNTLTVVSVLEPMSGYRYYLRVTGICTPFAATDTVTLTVTRQAEITQHPQSLVLCEGAPATFTVNAGLTTGPSYQWQISTDGGLNWLPIGGATNATYTIPAVATADNNTAYRAVVRSTCGSSITSLPAYLTVNELPEIVTQPLPATVCEYAIADFTVDAGVTTGATYRWQRSINGGTNWNDLTESATYFGVSTMNLKVNGTIRTMDGDMFRVIVRGTCLPSITSDEVLLRVGYRPEILSQPVAASICENSNTSFTVTAQGAAITAYQWFVDPATGIFEAVTNTGIYSGATTNTLTLTNVPRTYDNYRYRVEISGTCAPMAVSATVLLDVAIATIINVQPADTAICEFMTASFRAQVDGANLLYQWQTFNGSSWVNLTNTGLYLGVQTPMLMIFGPSRTMNGTRYRVIITSTCSAPVVSDDVLLTVNTAPELSDHPDEFKGCPGGTATFSVVAAGTNLGYQWQVNSGTGFNNVSDDGTYSGTTTDILTINNLVLTMNGYLVRVVVSGTCLPPATSIFAPLRVYMEPSIIDEPDDAEVCNLTGVSYYAQVFTTGAGETTRWQVNQGSGWGALADNAQYQGTQTPQLIIMSADTLMNGWHYRLEITGPCGIYHTREALLTVNAPPKAQIAPTDTILVCGGVPTQLHGNPYRGSGTYITHRWYGDIGPLSQFNIENPMFNTSQAGFYRLVYQVTDSKGCVGLDTVVVEVEKPVAMFTTNTQSGCQPLTVKFTNASTGYATLSWDFGDGNNSTAVSPTHIYPNPGPSLAYYTVKLEITSVNGCKSTMETGITVYPEILSDFIMSEDTICSGERVIFSTLPGAFRYTWTYGDGTSPQNGSNVIDHVFLNATIAPVTYNVTLKTESFFGCNSQTTLPLVVYPTPIPAFIATPPSQTMPNATVTFTNNTNPGTWFWLWEFADGNTSTVISPVHTYAASGVYDVRLTASNAYCSEKVTRSVSILPTPPIAEFDSIPSGCIPWNITIKNTSLYATSYFWDFGDGYTSNAKDPVYTYVQAGTYRITLTATGPGGTDVRSRLVNVYQAPKAYFEVSPPVVYVNDEKVRLFNLSEGADSFIWEFGDGDTSHVRDPYHKYTTEGIYDITLHAYSVNGCYDDYVLSPAVTVEPFGEIIYATVFKPNQTGEIDRDDLPTSGEEVDQFFYPPIRETVLNYHLQIFNRWGTLIFETWDINKPWNGYYKGRLCQQGVYVWLVEGKYANGRPFKKAGDITLLH